MNPRTKKTSNKLTSESTSPEPKSQKKHTVFKVRTHQGTKFLKEYISSVPNDNTRFICKLCKEKYKKNYNGFCENLKTHLQNNASHLKTLITDKLVKDNNKAINHLIKQSEPELQSNLMEEEEENCVEEKKNISKTRYLSNN